MPESDESVEMDVLCLDTGERTRAFDSIGPGGEPKAEREFIVVQRDAPFLYKGKHGRALGVLPIIVLHS